MTVIHVKQTQKFDTTFMLLLFFFFILFKTLQFISNYLYRRVFYDHRILTSKSATDHMPTSL